ncbi:MAG: DMT family transporter [Flavobacteriaceae bacterium]|nr:DMT family transporter [Flavobacteriaceae bacterium]
MSIRVALKFMLISTVAFACMNVTVKYLEHISAYQIVFFRSFGSLFFTFGFLLRNKIPILGTHRKLLVFRGLAGVTAMTLFFMSIKYLPVGTAVSLRYLSPIFAALFAMLLLKEKVRPLQWLFFAIAFAGVLIMKGLDAQLNSLGMLLILIASVFSGLVYIIINKIGKREHPVVIVNYFMVIATITGGLLSINTWVNPVGIQWLLLFSLGIYGYIGQVYMTKAFQATKISQVAPLKYVEVIFTVALGVLLVDEVYSIWSLLGIVLIIVGLLLNSRYATVKN